MPWSKADVDKHNSGLSEAEKSMWVRVANKALRSGDDEGTAIQKASGAVKKAVKS